MRRYKVEGLGCEVQGPQGGSCSLRVDWVYRASSFWALGWGFGVGGFGALS